jgi:hypothetical protein
MSKDNCAVAELEAGFAGAGVLPAEPWLRKAVCSFQYLSFLM